MSPIHYTLHPHAHYLTFSCYQRLWLFKDSHLYVLFLENLEVARQQLHFKLYGFVVMPNHVHLLVFPAPETTISSLLSAVKGPIAFHALPHLQRRWPKMYEQLDLSSGAKVKRRFWQVGGGYDRNIYSDEAFAKTLNYMHLNPVRKELVEKPEQWEWSSAPYYQSGICGRIEIDKPDWR